MSTAAIVIPSWNAEKWLARAIRSALNQEGGDCEILVIDDGSSDRSIDVIKSYGKAIRWETGPNRGAVFARNRGLQLARSDFVIFLDADDYLASGSIHSWVRLAVAEEADIVLAPFAYEREGRLTYGQRLRSPIDPRNVTRQWLEGWFTPPCAVLWRRAFLNFVGGWNTSARLARSDDGELAMRAMLHGPRIAVAHAGLGIYVQHESAGRISRRTGAAVMDCELSLLRNLWGLAETRGYADLKMSFARAFYRISYEAYANGVDGIGRDALLMARQLGLHGHVGTVVHCGLAPILGLRRKLRLTGWLKGRKIDDSCAK
jgi:glycosyltransferase involved in cell wall biosynthesis